MSESDADEFLQSSPLTVEQLPTNTEDDPLTLLVQQIEEATTDDGETREDCVTALAECIDDFLTNTSVITCSPLHFSDLLLHPPSPIEDIILDPPTPFRDELPTAIACKNAPSLIDESRLSQNSVNERTTDHVDATCDVCRGKASTSTSVCRCSENHCRNCGIRSDEDVCARCSALPKCNGCHRHLGRDLFDSTVDRCRACVNRRNKDHVRSALNSTVQEFDLDTVQDDYDFESYIARQRTHFDDIVSDSRDSLG